MAQKVYSERYAPDAFFMKQLKELDVKLGVRFREDLTRFVITWERPWGLPDEIMVVSKPYFRQPDRRELMTLCGGDLHREGLRAMFQKTSHYFNEYRRKQTANEADDIRNATKDDRRQLQHAYRRATNTGSKPSVFRRITPKPRGKSVDELQNIGVE